MSFDYNARLGNVINVLNDYNTTTSAVDLSGGLTTRVKNIFKNDIEKTPPKKYDLPCVYVRIGDSETDFAGLGETGIGGSRKEKTVNYDIIGLYQKEGIWTPDDTLTTEVLNLARNIEGIFDKEITLSNTALWCNTLRADFVGPFEGEGNWVKGVYVQMQGKYHYQ